MKIVVNFNQIVLEGSGAAWTLVRQSPWCPFGYPRIWRKWIPMKFCVDTGTTGPLDCENSPEPLQLTDWHYFSRDCLGLKKNIATSLSDLRCWEKSQKKFEKKNSALIGPPQIYYNFFLFWSWEFIFSDITDLILKRTNLVSITHIYCPWGVAHHRTMRETFAN